MTLIDDIKRDRVAGTPGPWELHNAESFDGRATYRYKEVWSQDLDVIAAEVYRAHGDGGKENMNRIARVPDMEAALLAADEFIKAALDIRGVYTETYLSAQLAAYRAATGDE